MLVLFDVDMPARLGVQMRIVGAHTIASVRVGDLVVGPGGSLTGQD